MLRLLGESIAYELALVSAAPQACPSAGFWLRKDGASRLACCWVVVQGKWRTWTGMCIASNLANH